MMKADNLISDKVICSGIVRPDAAARGCGEVKDGFENKYVFSGFACCCYISPVVYHFQDLAKTSLRAQVCAPSFPITKISEKRGMRAKVGG